MKENKRKCVKCGISPADDPDIKLFRFPRPGSTNVQRCELWAKYCYPHDEWSSVDFQKKLYASHKMLCHQHFKESSFIDYPTKQLRKFDSPDAEEVTMPCLENNENVVARSRNPLSDISNELAIPGPSGLGATVSNPYFYYNRHEVQGIAKWSYIVQFHELDNTNPNYAFAPLLKPEHLNPNTKQKMRVKLAVQVLSHTVSPGMYARIGQGLPAGAIVTADLISKMDKLFDTLNSDTPDLRRFFVGRVCHCSTNLLLVSRKFRINNYFKWVGKLL